MNLPIATYSVLYNSKDITKDISGMVTSLSYTDKLQWQTDEIEISVENKDELWINSWYPKKGDTVQVVIFSEGQLNCGTFSIDEMEATEDTNAGNTFTFKGVAAAISKQMRTKRSYAHADKSLKEIANTVAANLGLTLTGSLKDITVHCVNQYRETDLAFLNRIGAAYGYVFSVRGNNLVFLYYEDLENQQPSLTFKKSDRIRCSYKDTTNKVFKSVSVRHHNPKTKQVVVFEGDSDDDDDTGDDDLNLHDRVENTQQAEAVGKHALHEKNKNGVTCEIEIQGNILFVSGNNIQLNDSGVFNGKYQIIEATHKITLDGSYSTSGTAKRISK